MRIRFASSPRMMRLWKLANFFLCLALVFSGKITSATRREIVYITLLLSYHLTPATYGLLWGREGQH